MNFDASIDFPAQTILSGPAASVMGAIPFSSDKEEIIVLDIGGTTTDIAVLINKAPVLNPTGIELGGYKTLIRSLYTHSIPIGGDSKICLKDGELVIGPERAGSAMAYGGPHPTPTDALIVLEKYEKINRDKSIAGIQVIANGLGISLEEAALKIIDSTCKKILSKAREMVARINSKPVYTVHELKEGHKVKPERILVLGGPAPYFCEFLKRFSGFDVNVVSKWHVANAIGAALAKTTCEVTLFADTELGKAFALAEGYQQMIKRDFNKNDAFKIACELLKKKAFQQGADSKDFEVETLEQLEFNMVKGFYTSGKNIRIKVQVKPGLIHNFSNFRF